MKTVLSSLAAAATAIAAAVEAAGIVQATFESLSVAACHFGRCTAVADEVAGQSAGNSIAAAVARVALADIVTGHWASSYEKR